MRMGLIMLGFGLLAMPAAADEATARKRGEALLERHCSPCHATAKSGESPYPPAPPFRALSKRYPVEFLEEALGEGIVTGHPAMPEFEFAPGEVGAIIAYLKSIQEH
jgi:cytochrome c